MNTRRGFLVYTLRRLLAAIALLIGVTIVTFVLVRLVPGDPVTAALGGQTSNPKVVAAYRHRYKLDKPLPLQYVAYMDRLLHGDLGESEQTLTPVAQNLSDYVPATLELALPAMTISFILAVVLGLASAMRRGSAADQTIRVTSLLGVSTPPFWLALLAIYVIGFKLNLLPHGGRLGPEYDPPPKVTGLFTVDALVAGRWSEFVDALDHLILPVVVLAAYGTGLLTRFARAAALDVHDREYIRSAWAKGIPARMVLLRHILRPALIQIITVSGLAFASLLAGAVLIEQAFSWPGIGEYAYRAANALDLPAIMGVTLFVATCYVVINLVVDLLYGVIDPRIRVR
jgi:peptide/nickel transport system permease protein